VLEAIPQLYVFLDANYANQTYYTCRDICIFNRGYVRDVYPDPTSFWASFNTDYNPNYHASADNPRIFYQIGTQPYNNGSVNLAVVPDGPNDIIPCPSTTALTTGQLTTGAFTTAVVTTAQPATGNQHSTFGGAASLTICLEMILLCAILSVVM